MDLAAPRVVVDTARKQMQMAAQQHSTTTISRVMKTPSLASGYATLASIHTASTNDSRISTMDWRKTEQIRTKRSTQPAVLAHHQMVLQVMSSLTSSSRRRLPASLACFTMVMASSTRPTFLDTATSPTEAVSSTWLSMRRKASLSMTSAGGPISTIQPSSKSSSRSKCCSRDFSGCVTTMRVRPRSGEPKINSLKIWLPVGPSTAAKGSSIRTNEAASM
mmetsp:Transcript_56603/g.123796  ORF Transcript_56603/g.123796 Transcript_56603/m.123796 type:complete len:220 (-) Transcript_56603:78-737(-)